MGFNTVNEHLLGAGDSATLLPTLPSQVALTITSPPYDNLRTYGGVEWNFNIFTKIAKELFRVTKPGCVLVWIVGDATINSNETGTSFKQGNRQDKQGNEVLGGVLWWGCQHISN